MSAPTKPSDSSAWDLVYERTRPTLVRALTAATGTYDGVEDAIQAALAAASRRAPDDLGSVEGRLFVAALPSLRGRVLRSRIARRLHISRASFSTELDRTWQRNDLARVLNSLSDRERAVVIAKHYLGVPDDVIASSLHLSKSAVAAASAAASRLAERGTFQRAVGDQSHDPIAHRVVVALDGLPIPASPARRAYQPRSRLQDPRTLALAALFVVLVSAAATPQFREGFTELARWTERVLFGPGWVGYYMDTEALDASGRPAFRLLLASSDATGVATIPDIVGELADHGPWSPDRERITVHNGTKIYVADTRGRVREIADVGASFVVDRTGWLANDRVWAVLNTSTGIATAGSAARVGTTAYATIDLNNGSVDVRRLDTPLAGRAFNAASSDGRWLPVVGGQGQCGLFTLMYDLHSQQHVPLVDAQGRSLRAAVGFLSDGRLPSLWCDRAAGRFELFIGVPGSVPALVATLPIAAGAPPPLVIVNRYRDEIVVVAGSPAAEQAVAVFDATGRQVRTLRVPQLTDAGGLQQAGISRDAKFFSFVVDDVRAGQPVTRAGVVDLTTGQVTYFCDGGCARLALR